MTLIRNFTVVAVFFATLNLFAKEGLWLPALVEQLNYSDLQAAGFKLSADEIYSINKACLKDAVVLFGNGCTGAIVSPQGLLFTNHHCGAGVIANHSTVKHNYLVNGYWARNRSGEISNLGLTVKFLVRMADFTDTVLSNIPQNLSYSLKQQKIQKKITDIENAIEDTSACKASIESFYAGNNYYLFLYKEYRDIRLVGTPPECIANFGGDTDNWIWPRHAADFSVFRVYTAPDGSPADYSPENIPLKPRKYFTLNERGIKKGEFTMVMGYPGNTSGNLYSGEVEYLFKEIYPMRIRLREGRLDIINKARAADSALYLLYASEQKAISNPYKKWEGVLFGFSRFDVVDKRKAYEQWLLGHSGNKKDQLQEILDMFEDTYRAFQPYDFVVSYLNESIFAIKSFKLWNGAENIINLMANKTITPDIAGKRLKSLGGKYLGNTNGETEKSLNLFLLKSYKKDIDELYVPAILKQFSTEAELISYVDKVFSKSAYTDTNRFKKLVDEITAGKIKKTMSDPLYKLFDQFRNIYVNDILADYSYYKDQYKGLYHDYIPLIQSIDSTRKFYPDANMTMRLSYGNVEGYSPADAVEYSYQTYLDGLFQKVSKGKKDYQVTKRLEDLYANHDFGDYADSTGGLPLCFIASNQTSGGNSGSPVLDGNGYLIGLNFDRTWETTMSDFYFDDSVCRNISVDIRYILFIIDKYSNAGYLLDEMNIVK